MGFLSFEIAPDDGGEVIFEEVILTLEEFEQKYGVNFLTASGLTMGEEDLGNLHLHYNPTTEFYNTCHAPAGPGGGRFCAGPDGPGRVRDNLPAGRRVRDTDGQPARLVEGQEIPRGGKYNGSKIDPNEGTQTIDGVKGYDAKGKPVPGSDAWLQAHHISKEVFEGRPYVKFEPVANEPAIAAAYEEWPHAQQFFLKKATDVNQAGGYIMVKHPIPGSPFGSISPQIRPNEGIVTNPGDRARKGGILKRAETTLAAYKELKKDGNTKAFVNERKEELKAAELNQKRIMSATPDSIRANAEKNLKEVADRVKRVKETGTDSEIAAAKKDMVAAKRDYKKDISRADNWDQEKEQYDAQKRVEGARNRLAKAQENPAAALDQAIKSQENVVKRAENAFKKSASKYTFAPKTDVARLDVGGDPENVKNLTKGKGRIYLAMEGAIKHDAILTAVKKEDPTAAVVNVPSVTLWQGKGGTESEVAWFARTYGKDREIVLVPDADGVNNPAVTSQAKALAGSLKIFGADQVLTAYPPLKPGTKRVIEHFKLPSGVEEARKGVDDHLGAGRGALGQLQYEVSTKTPSYSLKHLAKSEGGSVNKNAIENMEKALAAISSITGPTGSAQMSKKMIESAGNLKRTSALDARNKLQELGIIDVEWVFDQQALSRRRRVLNPDMSEDRRNELVRKKIIKEPNLNDPFLDVSLEESPVITIKDPKYVIKASDVEYGVLADRPTWNPPKTYKGWTSSVTGKTGDLPGSKLGGTANTRKQSTQTTKRKPVSPGSAKTRRLGTSDKTIATEAGAAYYSKLYGINLKPGDPIPILLASGAEESEATSLLSMVEFYNKCNDAETGRFCEGPDGPGRVRDKGETGGPSPKAWPEKGGRDIKTVSSSLIGRETVDGIPSRYVYEVGTKNGGKLRLYDVNGTVKEREAKALLNAQARMHELYPMKPAKNLIVTNSAHLEKLTGQNELRTIALTFPPDPRNGNLSRYTWINSNKISRDISGDIDNGFIMPSARQGSTTDGSYNTIHEYGHHLDFSRHYRNGRLSSTGALSDRNLRNSLSKYGQESRVEAYGEAFADWHVTNGTTENPATRAYAEQERWYNYNSITASGEVEDTMDEWNPLFSFNLLSFQTEGVSEDSNDSDLTDEEVAAMLESMGIDNNENIVGIRDTDHGPEIIGNLEVEDE